MAHQLQSQRFRDGEAEVYVTIESDGLGWKPKHLLVRRPFDVHLDNLLVVYGTFESPTSAFAAGRQAAKKWLAEQ